MKSFRTYHWTGRLTAFLLFLGLGLPGGLDAGTLMDFCSNPSTADTHQTSGQHDDCCCAADIPLQDEETSHSDCDSSATDSENGECALEFLSLHTSCTCSFEQAPQADRSWTISTKAPVFATFSAAETVSFKRGPPHESVPAPALDDSYTRPLYLLHSSFLN